MLHGSNNGGRLDACIKNVETCDTFRMWRVSICWDQLHPMIAGTREVPHGHGTLNCRTKWPLTTCLDITSVQGFHGLVEVNDTHEQLCK